MVRMSTRRTPRQIAREETLATIKTLALDQLSSAGAAGLSLRAIARDLGIVSSAVYRYFASRDELITALIVDAYGDLADELSGAEPGRDGWVALCAALRGWARAQPHRFALVYGSAIPGYAAPETTIAPAARVFSAFAAPARGATGDVEAYAPGLRAQLATTVAALSDATNDGTSRADILDGAVVAWVVTSFAAVIGALTLELNGHLVGTFDPADELFASLVEQSADRLHW